MREQPLRWAKTYGFRKLILVEAILFIGIQGSGKSSFYRQRFFDTHVRINLDMLKTKRLEKILLEACIAAKQPFVVDKTNASVKERAEYITVAKAAGFQVIGYHFRSRLREALYRNINEQNEFVVKEWNESAAGEQESLFIEKQK